MGELYRLDFKSGKSYIGITQGSSKRRFLGHKKAAEGTKSTCAVHEAWRKHGEPKLTVLAVLESSELAAAEIRAIAAYETLAPAGYNITPGGDFSPMLHPWIRARVSKSLAGHKINVGRKHTATSKENMAAAQRSLKKEISQEHKARLSESMKEKHKSGAFEATYKKISDANKGKRHSEATKLKMSAWQKGKTKAEVSKKSSYGN